MNKKMIIMRGLPSCGKSYRSKQLFEEASSQGIDVGLYGADEFWYKIFRPDLPEEYSFDFRYIHCSHNWNKKRVKKAVDRGQELIIIDNVNAASHSFCCNYAKYAHLHGYEISFGEPTSEIWKRAKVYLSDKSLYSDELKQLVNELFELSKQTHNVPRSVFKEMIFLWQNEIDLDLVLEKCNSNCRSEFIENLTKSSPVQE